MFARIIGPIWLYWLLISSCKRHEVVHITCNMYVFSCKGAQKKRIIDDDTMFPCTPVNLADRDVVRAIPCRIRYACQIGDFDRRIVYNKARLGRTAGANRTCLQVSKLLWGVVALACGIIAIELLFYLFPSRFLSIHVSIDSKYAFDSSSWCSPASR